MHVGSIHVSPRHGYFACRLHMRCALHSCVQLLHLRYAVGVACIRVVLLLTTFLLMTSPRQHKLPWQSLGANNIPANARLQPNTQNTPQHVDRHQRSRSIPLLSSAPLFHAAPCTPSSCPFRCLQTSHAPMSLTTAPRGCTPPMLPLPVVTS